MIIVVNVYYTSLPKDASKNNVLQCQLFTLEIYSWFKNMLGISVT